MSPVVDKQFRKECCSPDFLKLKTNILHDWSLNRHRVLKGQYFVFFSRGHGLWGFELLEPILKKDGVLEAKRSVTAYIFTWSPPLYCLQSCRPHPLWPRQDRPQRVPLTLIGRDAVSGQWHIFCITKSNGLGMKKIILLTRKYPKVLENWKASSL